MYNAVFKLAALSVAVAGLTGFAHMYRYEVVTQTGIGDIQIVWDRWEHKTCAISMVAGKNKLTCSLEEFKQSL